MLALGIQSPFDWCPKSKQMLGPENKGETAQKPKHNKTNQECLTVDTFAWGGVWGGASPGGRHPPSSLVTPAQAGVGKSRKLSAGVGRCQAGGGLQPRHVSPRLLLHATAPHTPSGTHMRQETFPAGVGKRHKSFWEVLAGVKTLRQVSVASMTRTPHGTENCGSCTQCWQNPNLVTEACTTKLSRQLTSSDYQLPSSSDGCRTP